MNKKTLARWMGSAALTGALVCSMTPALAASLDPTAPSPSASPVTAPSIPVIPETTPATENTAPVTEPAPRPSSTADGDDAVAEAPAAPVDPEPGPTGAEDQADADPVEKTLEEEAGLLGARMGQGLERLLTTGDPQVPTAEEELQEVQAATSLEAPLEVPDTTAGEPPAATATATSFEASPAFAAASAADWQPAGIQGMDVSSHQSNVDWAAAWRQGARFAYTKATEGTYYKNEYYNQQYNGSANVGMVRGAYHFAIPTVGSGATEANFFVNNGGGWSSDGRTLPPLLDIEYNPYKQLGNICYNMSAGEMVTWIRDFSNTIKARTGRVPMIYTTTDWWRTCTGNTNAFSNHPLHLASYAQAPGALPNGWSAYNVWQYSSEGPFEGDSNVFKGNAAALDQFVRNNASAGSGSPAASAISKVAAANPDLGKSTSGVNCGLRDGGCYQNFQGGAVLWSPAKGAYASPNGNIRNAYQASGFENGVLGYPRSPQVCGLKGGGCFQDFEGGAILWSAATGARVSPTGAIRNAYQKQGFENGSLGYPTSGQVCGLKDNGCYQNFNNGAILWSPATGAQISPKGAIRTAYKAGGYENGSLGYPKGPQVCGIKNNGCYQDYQGGAILWSAGSGAQMSPNGAIRNTYQKQGFENGSLGYPTSGQVCGLKAGGCYQNYQGGAILWSAGTGAQVSPNGAIRNAYKKHGFENGGLGYPTGGQVCGIKDSGCYQNYQGGAITWTKSVGAHPTAGEIRKKWQSSGFEKGVLGYPTADESCKAGKCTQPFQGGRIDWTQAGGAVLIRK